MATNKDVLVWIHNNLGDTLKELTTVEFKDTPYTEALEGGLICRETGILIIKHLELNVDEMAPRMIGDRGHGEGFVQIDDRSYPQFIRDNPLSDYKAYLRKSILVLEEKRKFLESHVEYQNLSDDEKMRAILASYNSGQGNVLKSLKAGRDVDSTTYNKDYSKSVMAFRYNYFDMYGSDNEGDTPANNDHQQIINNIPVESAKAVDGHDEINPGAQGKEI